MALSPGKQRGLRALSNERGIIAAVALDQRTALRNLFAKASGISAEGVKAEHLVQFKELVSSVLSAHASAILLDPEYGVQAARQRNGQTGLLLAYEKSGYDQSVPGRIPTLLSGFSVERLEEMGADAVKVLLYYSAFSPKEINSKKQDWVERVGAECLASDIPFFLELVCYHDDLDEKGAEFARIKPDAVTRAIEEFCKPRYAADVLKIGVPVNMNFVESAAVHHTSAVYTRTEARAYFRRASQAAATLPFIYLSEGVSNETFVDALSLAGEAGSEFSGVLCGRAIWQDGVRIFVQGGASALEQWLRDDGVRNLQRVTGSLTAAHPWFEKVCTAPSQRT